jgi:hypothetical protein
MDVAGMGPHALRKGPQFKRTAALQGDFVFHGPRRLLLKHRANKQNSWAFGASTIDMGVCKWLLILWLSLEAFEGSAIYWIGGSIHSPVWCGGRADVDLPHRPTRRTSSTQF